LSKEAGGKNEAHQWHRLQPVRLSWETKVTSGTDSKKKRVISGMRPTGRLHIGHYFGALENWVRLQDDPEYESFHFIADWHALTSDYADTSAIAENTLQITIDFLASGLDPAKSTIFLQSLVPEHAELHLLLSMVTPLGWLERVPTYKEALENIKDKDLHNYGFLGYPVLQCADITIYSSPDISGLYVPVGEDQVSHVEASREIARRYNFHFGELKVDPALMKAENMQDRNRVLAVLVDAGFGPGARAGIFLKPHLSGEEASHAIETLAQRFRGFASAVGHENALRMLESAAKYVSISAILTEPDSMLTKTPRIPGTDGRKMSKSYGNAIMLSESNESIWEKVRPMKTDPARIRRTDKGDPDKCPVYDWHKLFSPQETLDWAAHGCRTAEIGCIDCKKKMVEHLVTWITPVRERRLKWENDKRGVLEILHAGSKEAQKVARATMERVREAVFHWREKKKELGILEETPVVPLKSRRAIDLE
jgi:tryptophanyl-tRNA synthetase